MTQLQIEIDYDRIDYKRLADEIVKRMKPDENIMWTSQDCANFIGCSLPHFRDRISKKPGFPKAVAGSDEKGKHKRWFKDDIVKWAK